MAIFDAYPVIEIHAPAPRELHDLVFESLLTPNDTVWFNDYGDSIKLVISPDPVIKLQLLPKDILEQNGHTPKTIAYTVGHLHYGLNVLSKDLSNDELGKLLKRTVIEVEYEGRQTKIAIMNEPVTATKKLQALLKEPIPTDENGPKEGPKRESPHKRGVKSNGRKLN